jgi:hypothetical protein
MHKTAFLLMAGLFSGLCTVTPATEVPEDLGATDVDSALPRAFELLKDEKFDVLWVGSGKTGWEYHSSGREAPIAFIRTDPDRDYCYLTKMMVWQDKISDGNFGPAELKWIYRAQRVDPKLDRSPIDCTVVDRVGFGYSEKSGTPLPSGPPPGTF